MKTSQAGLEKIMASEKLMTKAYICPAGVLTIGYGHTGSDVKKGMVITKQDAEKLFAEDIARFEKAVHRLVIRSLSQNQFDALVSFALNAGEGALEESTLRKLVNANPDDKTIVDILKVETSRERANYLHAKGIRWANIIEWNFLKWIYAYNPKTKKKEISNGLFNRRKDEAILYLGKRA